MVGWATGICVAEDIRECLGTFCHMGDVTGMLKNYLSQMTAVSKDHEIKWPQQGVVPPFPLPLSSQQSLPGSVLIR